MKTLHLNIYFKLPDDFEGGFNESLEEIIKYRKSKNLGKYPKIIEENKIETHKELWSDFWENQKQGKLLTGNFGISKQVGKKMVKIS